MWRVTDWLSDGSGSVRFRCFGPLEFWTGHDWRRVPGARPRTLLALLLTRPSVPLSVERLAHQLWSGTPPESAATAIRGYTWKLRRALGDATGETIVTHSGGYEVRCARETVDVFRFGALTSQAREALLAGKAEEAKALLTEALGLWRGEAFADVMQADAVQEECRRLQERRIDATVLLSECSLRLDSGAEVLDDLRALIAGSPLREELWLQLMRVLNATGRRGEALEAYRQARALLVAELGVEPGQELRELHQSLIEERAPVRRRVPRETARGAGVFVGREAEVAGLCADLEETGLAVVDGPPGTGKSELAIHVVQRLAERFPDGQIHLDLQGCDLAREPLGPLEALGRLLRSLGADTRHLPAGLDEATALLRTLTAGRRMLFLLDNAAGAAQVRPLLPGRSCAVLVTGRRSLAALGGRVHRLGPLAPADSVRMLALLVGPERVKAEAAQSARIAELCGHLPLALRVCAARLNSRPSWPLAALADRLADERRRLDELAVDDLTVRACLMVGCRGLPERSAQLFRLLGLVRWPELTPAAVAALSGRPEQECESTMEELCDARMLDSPRPGRYRLSDLVRLFAREEAERQLPGAERERAGESAVGFLVATGLRVTRLLTPYYLGWLSEGERALPYRAAVLNEPEAAIRFLDDERLAIEAAAADPRFAVALAAAWSGPLGVRGHWQDRITLNELALTAARRDGDAFAEARSCLYLAYTYGMRGDADRVLPLLRRARQLSEELGDPVVQSRVGAGLGTLLIRQGHLADGTDMLRRSLTTMRVAGKRHDEVLFGHQLGLAFCLQGSYPAALTAMRRAQALAERIGDPHGEYYTHIGLARLYRAVGETAQAIDCFERALGFARRIGERYGEPELLWEIGTTLGAPDNGRPYLDRALALLRESGDLPAEEFETLRGATNPARPARIDHDRRWAEFNSRIRVRPGGF